MKMFMIVLAVLPLASCAASAPPYQLASGTYYVPGEYIYVDLRNADEEEVYNNVDALLRGLALESGELQ